MSDTDEPEREPKKYCCGNSPQNEAGYVSKCDMGIAMFLLTIHCTVTVLTFTSPGTLVRYIERNPGMRDLQKYIDAQFLSVLALYWTAFSFTWLCSKQHFVLVPYQIIFLVSCFIWFAFEFGLAIYLFIAALKRDKLLLKKWFNTTVTSCLCGIAVALTAVYFLDEKVHISFIATIYYLYKWYGLWIVQELRNEIKSGVNPYAIPNHF